jgi:hypothetical protein
MWRELRRRGNVLTVGIVLLVILGVSLFLVGNLINQMGAKLNKAVVAERSRLHFNLIKSEFSITGDIVELTADYLAAGDNHRNEKENFALEAAIRLDPKVSRVWRMDIEGGGVESCFRDSTHTAGVASEAEREVAAMSRSGELSSAIYRRGERLVWCVSKEWRDSHGRPWLVGVDVPLSGLYAYMAGQNMRFASYASVFDGDGTVVFHPDSLRVSSRAGSGDLEMVERVVRSGETVSRTVMSDFLKLPVERFYYPLDIAGGRWVVGISVVWIAIDEEMSSFRGYTAIISTIAVVLFTVLLAFSQSRWRREHEKRMAAERHSSELQVQRIIDHINPHFLFNSLNSLYSLINADRVLAREFVLKLSGVYRYVLERRTEVLSTVGSEVDFIDQYVFLQKIRFDEQLEVTIDIDRRLYDMLIPSMGLQTLVENAIKHNRFSLREPLRIAIRAEGLSIVVENNLSPRGDGGTSTGLGLERLRAIYAGRTNREMTVRSTGGMFVVELPLVEPSAAGESRVATRALTRASKQASPQDSFPDSRDSLPISRHSFRFIFVLIQKLRSLSLKNLKV